jgi:hypothetical protein
MLTFQFYVKVPHFFHLILIECYAYLRTFFVYILMLYRTMFSKEISYCRIFPIFKNFTESEGRNSD